MANQRLTDKDALTEISDSDLIHVVDVSDTTGSPEGTSKKALWSLLKSAISGFFVTQDTEQLTGLTGDKKWEGSHEFIQDVRVESVIVEDNLIDTEVRLTSTGISIQDFDVNTTINLNLDAEIHDISLNNVYDINFPAKNGTIAMTPVMQPTETPTGTTLTIDFNLGNAISLDLESATGDVTFTLTNPEAGASYAIWIVQGSTPRNIVLPANVKINGVASPATLQLTEDDDSINLLTLIYDGTDYVGSLGQGYGLEGAQSANFGLVDYNDLATAGTPINLVANTWTDVPNDTLGTFTTETYLPNGMSTLMDGSTGYLDFSELTLGSDILIRMDAIVNPNINNSLFEARYVLGQGGGEYILDSFSKRLDSGSGVDYSTEKGSFYIYMGDLNTKDGVGKIQIRLSSAGTLVNNGVAIKIYKR